MATFTTILFGNGVGMALDPNYFSLQAGIKAVWDNEDETLTAINKRSILKCLPSTNGRRPTMPSSESELATLNKVVNACSLLSKVEKTDPIWLTEHGKNFPEIINYFIGRVAEYFHDYTDVPSSYGQFVHGLSEFIKNQCVHVATLNYDNLIYQPLIESEVLSGYNGHLIDGFAGMRFSEENMERHSSRGYLGWYLHLHGSPLFYDHNDQVRKLNQRELSDSFGSEDAPRRHIVLSHFKVKPEIISGSTLLASYWDYFGRALDESDRIIVIGYGGDDIHVNKKIANLIEQRQRVNKKIKLRIVEWKNPSKTFTDQKSMWLKKFDPKKLLPKDDFHLTRYTDILSFDWSEL